MTASKGCLTCRRRKKGCDRQKPSCQRCEADGLLCQGYGGLTTFVNYAPVEGSSKLRSVRSHNLSRSPPGSSSVSSAESTEAIALRLLPGDLASSAFHVQVAAMFLDEYLPKAGSSMIFDSTGVFWQTAFAATISRMSPNNPIINHTIRAMGLCSLASRNGDAAMKQEGAQVYGMALRQLNQVLQKPEMAATDSAVIPAIALMSTFEQFNGFSKDTTRSQSRNWHAHIMGVGRLLQLRGPNGFAHDHDFASFSAAQTAQFAGAFAARKGTVLASAEWREIPWRGRVKRPRDLFFDLVFPIPGLLERGDIILAAENGNEEIAAVIERLLRTLARMEEWSHTVRKYLPARFASAPANFDTDPRDDLHPLGLEGGPLSVQALDSMDCMLLFWAVTLNVVTSLRGFILALKPDKQTRYRVAVPDSLPFALSILRALPLYVKYGGIVGSQSILYPIGAIRNFIFRNADRQPEVTRGLGNLLRHAVREMEHAEFVEGFLNGIPAIRNEVPTDTYNMLTPKQEP